MSRRALPLLLLVLWSAPASAASAARFDLWFAGLRLGEVRVSMTDDGGGWRAEGEMTAKGLADLFMPSHGRAQAQGAWAGDLPSPVAFSADGNFGKHPQTVLLRHVPGEAPVIEAEPALRARDYDPAPETLVGALDPLSAAVAALTPRPPERACGRSLPVFDTRRRFDLEVAPGALQPDGRLRCEARYVRVSGFKDKHMALPPHPFTTWWTVRDGVAHFERAMSATPWGNAVILRKN
jgi:hypothetical protein